MENILHHDMELERMPADDEDRRVIWIKYFTKLERRNRVGGLVVDGWRIYLLMAVQPNIEYCEVDDICHDNSERKSHTNFVFIQVDCWLKLCVIEELWYQSLRALCIQYVNLHHRYEKEVGRLLRNWWQFVTC